MANHLITLSEDGFTEPSNVKRGDTISFILGGTLTRTSTATITKPAPPKAPLFNGNNDTIEISTTETNPPLTVNSAAALNFDYVITADVPGTRGTLTGSIKVNP